MLNKVHAIISVDSRGKNDGLSASNTDFLYQLTQPINFHKRSENKQYFIRIENIKLPVAFYNVNSNYNEFSFDYGASAYNVYLTQGNYTIDELIAEVELNINTTIGLGTVNITYDDITQKVTIQNTGGSAFTNLIGGGWQLIGFDLTQTIGATSIVVSNNVAYTNTTSSLKLIISNLVSNNVYSNTISPGAKTTNLQNVSVTIPVKEIRNEFVFINNHNGPMMKLPNISSINNINVRLVDLFNNVVNLNGLFFNFDIVIYEYNKSPLFHNN
jgi:hypothetical protein